MNNTTLYAEFMTLYRRWSALYCEKDESVLEMENVVKEIAYLLTHYGRWMQDTPCISIPTAPTSSEQVRDPHISHKLHLFAVQFLRFHSAVSRSMDYTAVGVENYLALNSVMMHLSNINTNFFAQNQHLMIMAYSFLKEKTSVLPTISSTTTTTTGKELSGSAIPSIPESIEESTVDVEKLPESIIIPVEQGSSATAIAILDEFSAKTVVTDSHVPKCVFCKNIVDMRFGEYMQLCKAHVDEGCQIFPNPQQKGRRSRVYYDDMQEKYIKHFQANQSSAAADENAKSDASKKRAFSETVPSSTTITIANSEEYATAPATKERTLEAQLSDLLSAEKVTYNKIAPQQLTLPCDGALNYKKVTNTVRASKKS